MIPALPSSEMLIPSLITFILVMTRVGFLFMMAPLLSAKFMPSRIRVAMVAVVSFAVFAALPPDIQEPPQNFIEIAIAFLGEMSVGAAAGLAAQLTFAAVDGAGRLMGIPMGLGFAQAVDPLTGGGSVVTSQFYGALIALVFLAMNVHHMLIRLIAKSFLVLPPGQVVPSPLAGRTLVKSASLVFIGAVQLAAPVLFVLLGVMVAIALLAKIAPKVNLFILSFAISISLGLVALRASLPSVVAWMRAAVLRIEPLATQVIGGF
ncbi:MAG: flagellar biosynthetic protein FliR [Proteobacteria bacterium]|nr:flagellar biosynthetic protein FliR [Pseudomonadota bacterium]